MEFRATTATNMRRMIAAAEAAQSRVRMSGGESALESTLGSPRQSAAPQAQPARAKSVNDVFASMISQVGGNRPQPMPMAPQAPAARPAAPAVGRNDPCPCGSGKKYKKCCGRNL